MRELALLLLSDIIYDLRIVFCGIFLDIVVVWMTLGAEQPRIVNLGGHCVKNKKSLGIKYTIRNFEGSVSENIATILG